MLPDAICRSGLLRMMLILITAWAAVDCGELIQVVSYIRLFCFLFLDCERAWALLLIDRWLKFDILAKLTPCFDAK